MVDATVPDIALEPDKTVKKVRWYRSLCVYVIITKMYIIGIQPQAHSWKTHILITKYQQLQGKICDG
jgi:hypothetical protein